MYNWYWAWALPNARVKYEAHTKWFHANVLERVIHI
jgi:hypothetical protein